MPNCDRSWPLHCVQCEAARFRHHFAESLTICTENRPLGVCTGPSRRAITMDEYKDLTGFTVDKNSPKTDY